MPKALTAVLLAMAIPAAALAAETDRYALSRPDGRAEILPAGTLRVKKRESLKVGAGETARTASIPPR